MITRPAKEKVYFKQIGKDLSLRFMTLEDDEWVQNRWTVDELKQGFDTGDLSVILLMFWRMLDDESKRVVRDVKVYNWDGMQEKEIATDDPVQKLKMLISGPTEAGAIVTAMFQMRKKSNADPEANEKKKLTADVPSPTRNSQTSSQPSMGSASMRSAG